MNKNLDAQLLAYRTEGSPGFVWLCKVVVDVALMVFCENFSGKLIVRYIYNTSRPVRLDT
jgi:hypothetical protein